MTRREERTAELHEIFRERIVLFDGAMGTAIHALNLSVEDFGGPEFENCNELLNIKQPDLIREIHESYLEAGADIVETNSFNGSPEDMRDFGLTNQAHELNFKAAQLAREAADRFSKPNKPRFVAGSMGPTRKPITLTPGVRFDALVEDYHDQARALIEGGADLLVLETGQDTRNIKAGLIAFERIFDEDGYRLPVIVSGTIEPMGTMLAGQPADAFVASLEHANLLSIGLNCATGAEFMTDHLRTIHYMSQSSVHCYPNAGLPDEEGQFQETPTSFAGALERFVNNGWVNLLGGCCGTTPEHIRSVAQMIEGKTPRSQKMLRKTYYSGLELTEPSEDNRPLLVGERTNEVGSRKFKRLIQEEKYEEASEIARRQVKNGAQVIDVNLENPDRDEGADIDAFYAELARKAIKTPFMIDTTDPSSAEKALTYCQGKSIINSINFEDGEDKFDRIIPLLKKYGGAVVIGSIDEDREQAQAVTRDRKLQIAQRAHQLCTEKWQLAEEDLIFDPLVFPCATGDENYIGSSVETVEAISLIKKTLPKTKTLLGVSNVSFGLPPSAREVVNAVFLYQAVKAGLDLAIVNTEKIRRYASIPDNERKLAEDLLGNYPPEGVDAPHDYRDQSKEQRAAINQHHIAAIAAHFRDRPLSKRVVLEDLPLDERLANYIIQGTKEGLVSDIELKRAEGLKPLEIINGPLMVGMSEVGRLFNNNELIVAEVLQSAEAMKAAVVHLEQFMERVENIERGKIILATVKGDVHDIGKNLVDIILTNNGYSVINLGIKVPPADLIAACREHRVDAIGLSGLLVKSAQQMVITASDLREAGITAPMLVGGAALSDNFTRRKILPAYTEDSVVCYAQDAMDGLSLMNRLMDPKQRAELVKKSQPGDTSRVPRRVVAKARSNPSSSVRRDLSPTPAPYQERIVRDVPQLAEVWSYLNPQMLYVKHLGFRGNFERMLIARDPKALELQAIVQQVQAEATSFMKVRAVWKFFDVDAKGNTVEFYEPKGGALLHSFSFPRQQRENGLCLADYVLPAADGIRDSVAMFAVTAGKGIRECAQEYKQQGEYLKSHVVQALALETAEATAEWLHRRIREDCGFPDSPATTMLDRFRAKYHSRRYSFGYAACPNLEDQQGLFDLLEPQQIGIELTEGYMMDPEASVSAIVFSHPDCTYFDVNN